MKPEQSIERYLCKKVREHNGMCVKLVPTGVIGIPDRLVITDHGVYFVELKCESGRLSPNQIVTQDRLRAMGQNVFVLWSCEDVDKFERVVLM